MPGKDDTTHVRWMDRIWGGPLRYTELNPVRAKLVPEAHAWAWSSASAHCDTVQVDAFLSMELWQNHWTNATWREYLAAGETESELASMRLLDAREGR
jgi:hypothetical protein